MAVTTHGLPGIVPGGANSVASAYIVPPMPTAYETSAAPHRITHRTYLKPRLPMTRSTRSGARFSQCPLVVVVRNSAGKTSVPNTATDAVYAISSTPLRGIQLIAITGPYAMNAAVEKC